MRTLLCLSLLALVAAAQEEAAELFFRAYWLEQAGGRLKEAEALYENVVKSHPQAPEAPRALVGLIRIRAGRGEDAAALAATLAQRYPDAKDDLREARRVLALFARRFDPEPRPDDPPAIRRLKDVYGLLTKSAYVLNEQDRELLIDLGAVAHPMLAEVLRGQDARDAREAASILLRQRTPEADRLIARALTDDGIPYRGVIVDQLDRWGAPSPLLVDGLARLYDQAPPRLRSRVVAALARQARYESEGQARAWAVLTRALDDSEDLVRSAAAAAAYGARKTGNDAVPDGYLARLLALAEAGDQPVSGSIQDALIHYAHRPGLSDRILKLLVRSKRYHNFVDQPEHEEGAMVAVRVLLAQRASGDQSPKLFSDVQKVAAWSAATAAALLEAVLERDDGWLLRAVERGVTRYKSLRGQLGGEQVARVRLAALRVSWVAGEPNPGPLALPWKVLNSVGLLADDYDAIVAALKKDPGRGLPGPLLTPSMLAQLTPERAAALVDLCRDASQAGALLGTGRRSFLKRKDRGVAFFARVLPAVGPAAARELRRLAESAPELAVLVARRLLDARGKEWGWDWPRRPPGAGIANWNRPREANAGPYVWDSASIRRACREEPLQRILLGYAKDPRERIAVAAAEAAAALRDETVLATALESSWGSARAAAISGLARGPEGAGRAAAFAGRAGLTTTERDAVLAILREQAGEAYTRLARQLLLTRKDLWAGLWSAFYARDKEEAVALALAEVAGSGGKEFRYEALRLLTRVDDPRRIEVFRSVLQESKDKRAIQLVLSTVRDQYLVELGIETLAQLRSPDDTTRMIAHQAVGKLKFYTEARKAFEK